MDVDITLDMPRRVAVMHVRGDLDGASAPALSGSMAALLGDGGYDLVVDLTDAGAILAGGVRALRRGVELAHAGHRDIAVSCPQRSPARPALVVAGLDLPVFDSPTLAVQARS
jgi:anti-anti-sigma regulatory factor